MNVVFLCSGVIVAVLFTFASKQDWETNSVSGELCLTIAICLLLTVVEFKAPIWVVVLVGFLGILVFLPFEIPYFGDADLLPVAAYIGFYLGFSGWGPLWEFVYLICLLVVLFPYAKIYAKEHGWVWTFGCGKMVPMLPAFTIAWWMSLIINAALYFLCYR